MTIDEAIKKVSHYYWTGMEDYFTSEEIFDLEEMLKELKERRARGEEARNDFMKVVYDELSDDADNYRANRIIDAADDYAEGFLFKERGEDEIND